MTENSLDLSLTSSGGEENEDEDVSFSEPPLDDEDGEPLTRPSSGFTPSPQPLTSTQKPQGQKVDDKQSDKKQIGKRQRISLERSGPGSLCCVLGQDNLLLAVFPFTFTMVKRKTPMSLPFFEPRLL